MTGRLRFAMFGQRLASRIVLATVMVMFATAAHPQAHKSRAAKNVVARQPAVEETLPLPLMRPVTAVAPPSVSTSTAGTVSGSAQMGAAAPAAVASVAAVPPKPVSFDGSVGVVELKYNLAAFKPEGTKSGSEKDHWYVFTAVNASARPVFRALQAGQPPGTGHGLLPHSQRPALLQVTSTDPAVTIESANDYGRRTFRIGLPAGGTVALAVRMNGADDPPSLLAWTEPALAAHNRWMAVFIATVAGLIAAAAAIAGGLAFMSHHAPPRWATWMLLSLLLMRLAAIGLFDGSLVTPVGGPYGLKALFAGLAMAAGLKLVDTLLPLRAVWPRFERHWVWALYGLIAMSVLAYLGVPLAAAIIGSFSVPTAIAVAAYVIYWARKGSHAARALAPGAIMFALYCVVAGFAALGGFGANPLAPDIAGGFLATSAVLLILALVAGEGVGLMAFMRTAPAGGQSAAPAVPHAAIEAIDASFQGVFEIDFSNDSVVLSRESAVLLGLARRIHTWHTGVWLARLHPEDRPIYEKAIADFCRQTDYAFRIEFRARDEDGQYLWFELRAATRGRGTGGAERCVGLLADVTMRKEAEVAAMDRTLRDALTGQGNRVALMEALDTLGPRLKTIRYVLIDIDGYKALRAAEGDGACDELLSRLAERLSKRFRGKAQLFRVGSDSFALLVFDAKGDPAELGSELMHLCAEPYRIDGRSLRAAVSAGVVDGRSVRDPFSLINAGAVALRLARFQGGARFQVYGPGQEAMAPADALGIEDELRRALEADEIELCYQPVVRLTDRTLAGFEARARWRHPMRGAIAPCELIAHSEDTALVQALGRYVLARAAGHLAEWQRYFPLSEALFVQVTPMRRQWQDASFDSFVADLIRQGELATQSLVLGVAEDLLTDIPRWDGLRMAGAGLEVICYNSGGVPLKGIENLPYDMVRLDRGFVIRDGGSDDTVKRLVTGVGQRKRLIADGIDCEDDAARMADAGVVLGQGFLFAEPLSLEETLNFIAQNFRAADSEIRE